MKPLSENEKIKVIFLSYPCVRFPGGGVWRQIEMTKKYLEKTEKVEVEFFNPWKSYNLGDFHLFHLFSGDMRNHFLLKCLPKSLPLIVSPIIDKVSAKKVKFLVKIFSLFPSFLISSYKTFSLLKEKGDFFIARSNQEKEILEKGLGISADKIEIIPNGVEKKFFFSRPDYFYEKYKKRDFVLYVGQIGNKRKNLLRLLEVAEELKNLEFVLIGPILNTPLAKKTLKKAKKLKNVKILGKIPEKDLISAYSACQVFVLPSLIEGTGLVALEAGLAGAKIAITKYGGVKYYFKDKVEYLEPRSKDSIKKAIIKAINSSQQPALKNYILENFTWEKIVLKLIEVYKKLIKNNEKKN